LRKHISKRQKKKKEEEEAEEERRPRPLTQIGQSSAAEYKQSQLWTGIVSLF
jgi:hypothetical protein